MSAKGISRRICRGQGASASFMGGGEKSAEYTREPSASDDAYVERFEALHAHMAQLTTAITTKVDALNESVVQQRNQPLILKRRSLKKLSSNSSVTPPDMLYNTAE